MIHDNEVRKQVGKSLEETMRDYIDGTPDDQEDYIYTGIVVDNKDPDQEGKCRIRVYSIFSNDIPDKDLPWALPDFAFVGSKVGSFTVPPVGAIVNVYFDKGNIYLPHYTTKAVDRNHLPTQRKKDYPDNIVLIETDDGDYITFNRKKKVIKVFHHTGSQIVIDNDGEATLHAVDIARLDAPTKVVLGDSGGYVVTAPSPGAIATQSGVILTAQERLRA